MGNPCRYIFDNKFIRRPDIDMDNKRLSITVYSEVELGDSYKELSDSYKIGHVDFYSAPDVIWPYANGNTNSKEFRRYWRDVFEGLKLISKTESGECTDYVYSYTEFVQLLLGDQESEEDIPIGKFAGMTYEQVQEYKRVNVIHWI